MTVDRTISDSDLEAARRKYDEERDKRMRSDHDDQYIAIEGDYAELDQDPYVEKVIHRDAIVREVEVAVVGAGLSGTTAAVELTKAGIQDFVVIDKAGDFGGTWYWNRYPGVRCDVEAYIYLPYLEETGYVPTEKYTRGDEIFAYFQLLARQHGLYDHAIFQTRITSVVWDENSDRWEISTDRGDTIRARYVIYGTGPLSRPKLPAVEGIDDYRGKIFLSSRWDYDYTGGDQTGNLTNLRGKKVAVIGTGASAVQAVPHVAEWADHLYVFQRTPSAVDVRDNRATDSEWFDRLPSGWQSERIANFDAVLAGLPFEENQVADAWSQVWGGTYEIVSAAGTDVDAMMRNLDARDLAEMSRLRDRVDEIVTDPAVAEALKPYFNRFCKRPTFNDEYLQTFNRSNVTLVDTDGKGVRKISPRGIEVGGVEYEVDCIIFATGFELAPGPARAGGFDIIGRDGRSWGDERRKGVSSLHGIMTSGYPNVFVVGGQHHAAVTINLPYVFTEQSRHVAAIIGTLRAKGVVRAEVRPEAQRAWGEIVEAKSVYSEAATAACTPGNWNNEGDLAGDTVWKTRYGGGPVEYIDILQEWITDGLERDLELTESAPLSRG